MKELGEQPDENISFLTSEHAMTYIKELETANKATKIIPGMNHKSFK